MPPAEPVLKAQEPAPAAKATKAAAVTASVPDERIVALVESLKVSGIRSSGSDSRVLMNGRLYRVNEIVDRALGVRLVEVGTDRLTFTDANGFTYVKQF